MATSTLVVPMPAMIIVEGMYLRLEAISPTTGAAVANVTATSWAIYGEDVVDASTDDTPAPAGPFMLVPGPDATGA